MFKFIKKTHKYYCGDIELPSVTSVLPYSFFGNDSEYNRDRGSKVHDMLYLYNMNDLDEDNLDTTLAKYLEGYKKFLKENRKPTGDINKDVIVPFAMHCLYLNIDGGYKLSQDYSKDYRHNRDIFLNFLTVHQWKKNNGLLKGGK